MKLSPEVNLLAVAHYLQALDVPAQGEPDRGDPRRQDAEHPEPRRRRRRQRDQPRQRGDAEHGEAVHGQGRIDEMKQFVEQVYFVDVCAVAAMYPEWPTIGAGVTNYLAVPDLPLDEQGHEVRTPGGTSWTATSTG